MLGPLLPWLSDHRSGWDACLFSELYAGLTSQLADGLRLTRDDWMMVGTRIEGG